MRDFTVKIREFTLEYFDDEHLYLVDGLIVPSITQILKIKFGGKYEGIGSATLQRAAEAGTAVHEAIEAFCMRGEESDLPEVRNFKFLQKQYGFDVLDCEVPVLLFDGNDPIAAGRLDLMIRQDINLGIADIKRTSALDKDYLAYQLNLYRIAYQQSYGIEVQTLHGIHLREDVRKFVQIPVNEAIAYKLIMDWRAAHE